MKRTFVMGAAALVLAGFGALAQQGPQTDTTETPEAQSDFDDMLSEPAVQVQPTRNYVEYQTAKLRTLDKITGRSTDFEMKVGEPKVYGSLRIDLKVCFQTPPEEAPESAAFLKITSATSRRVQTMAVPRDLNDEERAVTESADADVRFSGWMFASSPGLSALEDPVYDLWVIHCTAVVPSQPAAPAE